MNYGLEEVRDVLMHEVLKDSLRDTPSICWGVTRRRDHVVFRTNVHQTKHYVGDGMIIAGQIADDGYAVAEAVLIGLTMAYAKQERIKLAAQGNNERGDQDYYGARRNKRDFLPLAERFGLLVKYTKDKGCIVYGISDEVRTIVDQHHWEWPMVSAEYTYGNSNASSHNKKFICPECGMNCTATSKDFRAICWYCDVEMIQRSIPYERKKNKQAKYAAGG
jgi:hypothetical protein